MPVLSLSKHFLITPLDWGLGHATRCIPIIRTLLAEKQTVSIATDGGSLQLLKEEFPTLRFFKLPSYRIKYRWENMVFNMALQMPHILRTIWQEHRAIQKIVSSEGIDVIISDNRFGCYHTTTHNIFLTHQLNIKAPHQLLEKVIAWGNHFWIKRFDECWVPDVEKEALSLAGELSHGTTFKRLRYLGPLSRMTKYPTALAYDLVVVLSGPEPQRTYLETLVLNQLPALKLNACIVQGKAELSKAPYFKNNIQIYPYLTSEALNDLMLSAKLILCRSGYSTMMDLAKLEKKALLVPTPGQTEQEYLARYFCERKCFLYRKQKDLNLAEDYTAALTFSGLSEGQEITSQLSKIIKETIKG
ncbi:MAG: glycosyltransferase [Saprospiraceae bacterium]